jgi:phage repressor protein C with HTH and peptisase S24 domain
VSAPVDAKVSTAALHERLGLLDAGQRDASSRPEPLHELVVADSLHPEGAGGHARLDKECLDTGEGVGASIHGSEGFGKFTRLSRVNLSIHSPERGRVKFPGMGNQNQTFLQRELRRRMALLNTNPNRLEREVGEGKVKNILLGKSKNPRADTLQKIAKALGCSVADLTGENVEAPEPMQQHMRIEELDIRASAGGGTLVDDHRAVGEWQIPLPVLRGMTSASEQHLKMIPVVGDSMAPTFQPGQRVLVDMLDRTPSPPGVFVVWDGLGFVIKRIELKPHSDPLTVRIISDNPRYEPYERTLEEAYIQGRVIGGWTWT